MNSIADHLWQSTLFACVAGLLTLALRKNRARVRHWVWVTASLKFLIPLSVLIGLSSQIEWRKVPTASSVSLAIEEVSEPFNTLPVARATAREAPNPVPAILFGIWACGFIGISCAWWVRWRRIRDAVRAGMPVEIREYRSVEEHGQNSPHDRRLKPTLQAEARATTVFFVTLGGPQAHWRSLRSRIGKMGPGIFGVLRPALILPEGIFERLTPGQLVAVVEHELCHVRHRDNLVAAIHMFVETVFWFHPLVWWIGKRMVAERELGCDEEVVSRCGEARVYAEAILKVCKLYVESPLECVSGITGSDLKKRIEGIMTGRAAVRLSWVKKAVLASAGMAAVAVPFIVGVMRGQSAAANSPKFEVASIRAGCGVQSAVSDPGRMILCVTLRTFIRDAYVVNKDGQHHAGYVNPNNVPIEGGPGWVYSDRFTINAKAEGTASFEMLHGPMLQALLEDRFKLKIRRESRVGPAYALTVAKGGAKLQRSPEGSCVPFDNMGPRPAEGQVPCGPDPPRASLSGPNFITAIRGFTLDELSTFLFAMMDRPVLNQTGIAGRFDIRLEYVPDQSTPTILAWLAERHRPGVDPSWDPGNAPDPNGVSLPAAIQQQLGLRLEPTRASREFLVIDHVEKPSEN